MLALLFLYLLLSIVHVGAVPGRVLQGCTVLNAQVYCYGGYQSASGGVFNNMTNDHLTFNLDQYSSNSNETSPNWQTLDVPRTGPKLEPRSAAAITSLDDNRYMILGGGHGGALATPAAIFNNKDNTWTALPMPPFYMTEGAMVSSNANTVFAYGGKLNSTPNYTPSSLLKLDLTVSPGRWTVLTNILAPPISRYGHAMIIRNGIINFFGGFLNLPETNLKPNIVPLFNMTWYNTVTDQWGHLLANGDEPTARKYHTATLLGSSSKVLIYGGTNIANLQGLPLLDYIYTYDLNTHTYKKVNFTNQGGAGPRIGHSAIFYQDKVFISYGYDTRGNIVNDTHTLNVSNPDNLLWVGENHNNNTTDPGSGSDNSGGSKQLSSGAIAGIVIACLVVVMIIVALIYLRYRKRRRQSADQFDSYVPPPEDFNIEFPPPMSPQNGKDAHNDSSDLPMNSTQSTHYDDPAPSYPSTKPHQESLAVSKPDVNDNPSLIQPLSSVKPSGDE